jgi:large subunit ribosomal protein L6
MSRINKPVHIPSGVQVNINAQQITIKGSKGSLVWNVHEAVKVEQVDNALKIIPGTHQSANAKALAGTTCVLINNMVKGVSEGFEKKLTLIGVGYRAQAQGKKLNLTLGFSHPVVVEAPEGITIETPSQTEIVVRGADKQKVGQFAAEIRAFRPPEPYKGKGVRYADEFVILKEAKKK